MRKGFVYWLISIAGRKNRLSNSVKSVAIFFHRDIESSDATSTHVRRLSAELAKYFKVDVFVYSGDRALSSIRIDGYNLYKIPRLNFPLINRLVYTSHELEKIYEAFMALVPLMPLIAKGITNADLFLGIDPYCSPAVALIGKLAGKRFAYRPNDSLWSFGLQIFRYKSRVMGSLMVLYAYFMESFISKMANLILASSKKTMQSFRRYGNVDDKIFVSHTGGETEKADEKFLDLRKELRIPPDHKLLVFLGTGNWLPNRLAIEYSIKVLAPYLGVEVPKASILIVGRGTEEFRSTVETGNVVIIGEVPQIAPYLKGADLGIAPITVMGGQSSKIIDYLCSGLPVVATDIAAETVESQTGLFVSDIEEFPVIVTRLLKKGFHYDFRKTIRQEALRNYSWGKIGLEAAQRIGYLRIGTG